MYMGRSIEHTFGMKNEKEEAVLAPGTLKGIALMLNTNREFQEELHLQLNNEEYTSTRMSHVLVAAKGHPSLKTLDLADLVRTNDSLKMLDFLNPIENDGAACIADALTSNTTLERIH
jgi:hypothetical protein